MIFRTVQKQNWDTYYLADAKLAKINSDGPFLFHTGYWYEALLKNVVKKDEDSSDSDSSLNIQKPRKASRKLRTNHESNANNEVKIRIEVKNNNELNNSNGNDNNTDNGNGNEIKAIHDKKQDSDQNNSSCSKNSQELNPEHGENVQQGKSDITKSNELPKDDDIRVDLKSVIYKNEKEESELSKSWNSDSDSDSPMNTQWFANY